MLKDLEGNEVSMEFIENRHIKVTGKSGTGKTYWVCQEIGKFVSDQIPVLIVDFSGSYTDRELEKNFRKNQKISIATSNPKMTLVIISAGKNTVENVTDALIQILDVQSMLQRQLLEEISWNVLKQSGYISFKRLYDELLKRGSGEEESERGKNISFLMSRLYYLRNIDSFRVAMGTAKRKADVVIMQFSDYPERIRKSLAQFFLEIEWRNICEDEKQVQIILDEFQVLPLEGTAIEEMLREGRKYGVGMILLSQYEPRSEAKNILEQAATSIYFQPNERNIISTAQAISREQYKEWMPILKKLTIGTCVLSGEYSVNEHRLTQNRPLVCKVMSE